MMTSSHSLYRRFAQVLQSVEGVTLETLEWEVVGDDLWLRPAGADVRTVWGYLGRRDTGELLNDSRHQKRGAQRIAKARAAKRFWRHWPLEKQDGDLFLRRNFGLILLPDKPMMARFNFRAAFQDADDVLDAEPSRVEKLVKRLERHADFLDAIAWLQNDQDDWSDVIFERGSQAQLEVLLRGFWALFWPQDSKFDSWRFSPSNQIRTTLVWKPSFLGFPPSEATDVKAKRLFALLHEHIVVRSAPKRRYSLAGEAGSMKLPHILVSVPSMHDRMEGLLAWQEFLRDKVSAAETETLLTH